MTLFRTFFVPLLLILPSSSFVLREGRFGTTTRLNYQNHTLPIDLQSLSLTEPKPLDTYEENEDDRRRNAIKKELAMAAIEKYDIETYEAGMTTIAEDLMKQLEPLRPLGRPAHHADLNARWSFVFTGVPTIGMKLITLLSRISVGIPAIDFQDVFLEVSKQQTEVKAVVAVTCFGLPMELNVLTRLSPKTTDPQGTFLIEQFEGIHLCGVPIPTPESWHNARDLEITYLDQDMMIARTAGGEPHFFLRHSPCSTDDDSCDINDTVTAYFEEARAKYGEELSRSLVDRAFGEEDESKGANVLDLVASIVF